MASPRRQEVAAWLKAWAAGELFPEALQALAERALAEPAGGPAAGDRDAPLAEALADLDLLGVHLLTPEDVPALLALLSAGEAEGAAAVEAWRRYRDGLDLDRRSRRLRQQRYYRPFCR